MKTQELALFATQGGGYAIYTDGQHVWHELPDWMQQLPDGDKDKAAIGDPIPEEWGVAPANDAAQHEMIDDEYPWISLDHDGNERYSYFYQTFSE